MSKLKQLSKTDVSECDVMMYSAITQKATIDESEMMTTMKWSLSYCPKIEERGTVDEKSKVKIIVNGW